MNEAKAKFVKLCDKDSLKAIKKIMKEGRSPSVSVGRTILDGICKYVTADRDATYATKVDEVFASPEVFTSFVKNTDASSFEKGDIQESAQAVNMDAEGVKGQILK